MSDTIQFHHAKLLKEAQKAGVTVEDIARAWASLDRHLEEFDLGKTSENEDDHGGYYDGYVCETEEVISRATKYAKERGNAKTPL